jgi:hypothetical protein
MYEQNIEDDVIDVEEFAKAGKPIPNAKGYKIKVDKEKYTVDHAVVTGREVLTLAGYSPAEQYRLDLKFKGGKAAKVELDERVDLREPGVEKFFTMKLDQTEG